METSSAIFSQWTFAKPQLVVETRKEKGCDLYLFFRMAVR